MTVLQWDCNAFCNLFVTPFQNVYIMLNSLYLLNVASLESLQKIDFPWGYDYMNTAHADLICSYGLSNIVMKLLVLCKITIVSALISYVVHYSNITWAPWCLKLPASQLFVEKLVQPNNK